MVRLGTAAKMKSFFRVTSGAAILFSGICVYTGNEKFYKQIVLPLMHRCPTEGTHEWVVQSFSLGIVPNFKTEDFPSLATEVWGLKFVSPIGLAAGFDKQARAVPAFKKMGFSYVEIGSVTPNPQPGNRSPRVFRLPEDMAVVNRFGFNSDGHAVVEKRLQKLRNTEKYTGIVGVNLGANKESIRPVTDYVLGIEKFAELGDYFVVNISSPNTPGLRRLQMKQELEELLRDVNAAKASVNCNKPLLIKLSPDLTEVQREDIVEVISKKECKVDGLILCNTTVSRKGMINPFCEDGGISGAPLREVSTQMIADFYKRTEGKIPIIGVGGIFTGEDAYEKIKAGASLLQLYTSYIFEGPAVVRRVKRELNDLLERDGYKSIKDAVGKGSVVDAVAG